jgi:hypothetical protein
MATRIPVLKKYASATPCKMCLYYKFKYAGAGHRLSETECRTCLRPIQSQNRDPPRRGAVS